MSHLNLRSALTWAAALASVMPAQALPDLRIMPLGDSITKGSGSKDGNGYRNVLRGMLVENGTGADFSVDMIGSLRFGSMADNDHEGHSGRYLGDMKEYLELSIDARPNVILFMAGTNNMDMDVDIDDAPDIWESVIDRLFEAAPDATVLAAPVIWANNTRMQANTDTFNGEVEDIIDQKQSAGSHILSVAIDIDAEDLWDYKHPNDDGYKKMAEAWFDAIQEAHSRKWLEDPAEVNADDLECVGLGSENDDTGCEDKQVDDDDEDNGGGVHRVFLAGSFGKGMFILLWVASFFHFL